MYSGFDCVLVLIYDHHKLMKGTDTKGGCYEDAHQRLKAAEKPTLLPCGFCFPIRELVKRTGAESAQRAV